MARYRDRNNYGHHRFKYVPGDFKVLSDESGLTVMNSDTMVQWDHLKVHYSEFDPKHPQLIIYPRNDQIWVNNARPESDDDNDLTFGEGNADDL